MLEIVTKKQLPKESIVFDTYWKFAAERQSVFYKRIESGIPPWTDDNVLRLFKFTNAYRASDRVSQFLIKEVIYDQVREPAEMVFRIILFKIFNKIDTWRKLEKYLGEISYSSYSFDAYDNALSAIKNNQPIYSGAYIMASGKSSYRFNYKHQNHLKLLESLLNDGFHHKLSEMTNMEQLYNELITYPTLGSFLAFQYAIDINYSELTSFSEMEFVKAGPGAIDGIRKCFKHKGEYSDEDVIRLMCDRQEMEFERLEIKFQTLWGRSLQLIDCQNLFCEVDKYSRVAHPEISGVSDRKRIKQKFRPTSLKSLEYFYPPKWNLNQKIFDHEQKR
ncbi:MAG: putative DNA base hypermodification protein [Cytophagales bacterium]|nr:putative DNA base hypermodification protein [Cytophagales bacterium]